MARVRTIPKAVAEIKAKDPNTFITETMLRRLIAQGLVPEIECGYRYGLIDLDKLEEFLGGAVC